MRTLALIVFAAIFAGAVYLWAVPPEVAVLYLVASLACFALYARDKAAAKAGQWRTSEYNLLFAGLACGWPGAILAQKLMRHKSSKHSFKQRFWLTVMLNIAAFVYLSSPISPLRQL